MLYIIAVSLKNVNQKTPAFLCKNDGIFQVKPNIIKTNHYSFIYFLVGAELIK
jgi:hypothetical protein